MTDIKLTLSKDTKKRAPDIHSEARWLKKEGALYYELHMKPLRSCNGDWVYFIRDGEVVARAKASKFLWMSKNDLGPSYTGELTGHDGWCVKIKPPMQIASRLIPHHSFQGFRYVRQQEKTSFESAFAKQK
jgi:hypothetical protein